LASEHSKCPNCGGVLEYRADYRKFGCEECLSFFTDEQIKKMFKGKNSEKISKKTVSDEKNEEFCRGGLFECNSCGAEIITAQGKKTDSCPYCGGTVQKKEKLPPEYMPEYIIPFEITREKALEMFSENTGKFFMPSDLRSENRTEKITAVYVPVWMADCEVSIAMDGTGNVVKTWNHDVHRYTETREFAVERKADAGYSCVPSDACGKISAEYMSVSGGYDFSRMRRFEPEDLLAHPAEYCSADKGRAFRYVREKITGDVRSTLGKSVSEYADFTVRNEDIDILETQWSCALVPVWFMSWSCGGKEYRFAVNGQDGSFAGNPPVSVKKLSLFGFLAALLITVLYKLADVVFGFAGSPSESGFMFRSTGIGAIAGILLSLAGCFVLYRKYSTVVNHEPEKYPGAGETVFTARHDRYVRQYTTKVKAEET